MRFLLSVLSLLFAAPVFAAVDEDFIRVRATSDLSFGVGVQGDPAKTIPAGQSQNAHNASFLVEGPPSKSFSILLPQDLRLNSLAGAPDNRIALRHFTSFPEGSAVIGRDGQQKFFVGATLDPIPFNAPTGNYQGYFLVVVIY